MKYFTSVFLGLFILAGCYSSDSYPDSTESKTMKTDLPEEIQNLKNLTLILENEATLKPISAEKDLIFTETEDVFLGYAGNIAVDDLGRLYIQIGSEMGEAGILVFNSDGSFEKQLGRYGRGPSEFERIQDIQIFGDRLFVYENYEVHVFDLTNLSFSHSFIIKMESLENDSKLRGLRPGDKFFVQSDSAFLFRFELSLPQKITPGEHHISYSLVDNDGHIESKPVFMQRDFSFYNRSPDGTLPDPIPFTMPYTRSSLMAVSDEGKIYSAWNENFLIKIYDRKGNYLESIYMSYQNTPLSRDKSLALASSKKRRNFLENVETPNTWPAIDRIHLDNENRLWVAAVTENDSLFTWYVFNKNHETIGTFELPGQKRNRRAWLPSDLIIKNGFLYRIKHQDNYREPAEIIRYKIEFTDE
ncbi:MAG: 6-bladed beta-propeller [Gracilimonas sp.]